MDSINVIAMGWVGVLRRLGEERVGHQLGLSTLEKKKKKTPLEFQVKLF